MADANRWICALAIAPAAGVIGALARFKQTAGQTQKKMDRPS